MTDEQINFEKHKANLIFELTEISFKEGCQEYIDKGDWKTFKELDDWIDEKLTDYLDVRRQIREYYDEKISS